MEQSSCVAINYDHPSLTSYWNQTQRLSTPIKRFALASSNRLRYNACVNFFVGKASSMIDVNDLRKGVIFEMDNNLYKVLE